MSYITTILYKVEKDTDFDLEYCLTQHMPLCSKLWKGYGFTHWAVTKCDFDSQGNKPVYGGPESHEVMADIPKYSKTQPVVLFGKPVAEGTRRLKVT
ncbi:hypothetical protein BJX64DRAFT_283608 [Aspergillus heterothallicus]